MAGGVWRLDEWEHWIDNPELGPIAFQFGTRPLLTQESPIPPDWKARLMTLEEGDVLLHHFSPTGFYSSAVRNPFLRSLEARVGAPDRLHRGSGRRPCLRTGCRRRRAQELLGHQGRSAARARMACGRLHRGAENARRHVDLRRPGRKSDDPQGPGRLHGLPVRNAPFRPGPTMRRTAPDGLPTRAASASRRPFRTSPTAARSKKI